MKGIQLNMLCASADSIFVGSWFNTSIDFDQAISSASSSNVKTDIFACPIIIARGLASVEIAFLPNREASNAVVPLPPNGSQINSPGYESIVINVAGI